VLLFSLLPYQGAQRPSPSPAVVCSESERIDADRERTGMRTLPLSLLVFLVSACGASVSPYARATAGRIGCPASAIDLEQVEREGRGLASWVAYCGGTGYSCTSHGRLEDPRARIVCSELGKPRQRAMGKERARRWR